MKHIAIIFLSGATVGSLFDLIHVRAGVIRYSDHAFLDLAWWVAPQYGIAAVAGYLGASVLVLPKLTRRYTPSRAWLLLGSACAWLLIAYLCTAAVPQKSGELAAALAAAWLIRVVVSEARMATVLLSCAFAVVGTSYEIALVSRGLFTYAGPDLGGVPYWLAAMYLHASFIAIAAVRALRPAVSRYRSGVGSQP